MELVDTFVGKMWLFDKEEDTHRVEIVRACSGYFVSNCIRHGTFENEELKIVKLYLKPNMTCVDVGANVGLYSVLVSQRVGEDGTVYAFEPVFGIYEVLAKNSMLYKNICPFHIGLWSKEKDFEWHGRKFNVIVGDEFLQDVEKADFIKIDVDGAETGALKGLVKLIERSPKLLMIVEFGVKYLVRFGSNGEDFFDLVDKLKLCYGKIGAGGVSFKNNRKELIKTYLIDGYCNLLLWKGVKPFVKGM